eukprot:jgi/Psemu1/45469/gm1.45469_g
MDNETESATKRMAKNPWFPILSKEYCKQMKELQDLDLNPFLFHFETGFDAICAKNGHLLVLTILEGCKQIDAVRTRLNSKKGWFDKEEALLILEECFKHVSDKLFPEYEEGNTVAMDHVRAMGIIFLLNPIR